MNALLAYDWPGNVRELKNCIERCCAMNSGLVIGSADLPASMKDVSRQGSKDEPRGKISRISDLEKQAILGPLRRYTATSFWRRSYSPLARPLSNAS
jgi:DNA-binding NtrC family response regulator